MIKSIFFDFDGVLTLEGSGSDSTCQSLANQKNLPYEDIKAAARPYLKKLALAPDTYESILGALNNDLHSDITLSEMLTAAKSTQRNLDMYTLVQEIRSSGLSTGIITDNTVERMKLLHETFSIGSFEPVVISAEVGTAKWQGTEIFKLALSEADVEPSEAAFIDNTKDNLQPATELGIHTYWHDHQTNNLGNLRIWLQSLGIKIH